MKLTVLNGAWWDTQHCLPGQELNQCYLSDTIQDAWGQRKLKVTNAYCPEPRLNCRSTCSVGLHTYCFPPPPPCLTLQCVFISKPVDGIRLALDGWNSQRWSRTIPLMCRRFGDSVWSEGEEWWEISNPLPFDFWSLSLQKKKWVMTFAAWQEGKRKDGLSLFQNFHRRTLSKENLRFELTRIPPLLGEISAIESLFFFFFSQNLN